MIQHSSFLTLCRFGFACANATNTDMHAESHIPQKKRKQQPIKSGTFEWSIK